jgi:hypothetical protein
MTFDLDNFVESLNTLEPEEVKHDQTLTRLFYLADTLRQPIPYDLAKFISNSDIINGVAEIGLHGLSETQNVDFGKLKRFHGLGKTDAPASKKEYQALISSLAYKGVQQRAMRGTLSDDEAMKMIARAHDYRHVRHVYGSESVSLNLNSEFEYVPSDLIQFPGISNLVTVFAPQTLFCLGARPKTGKSIYTFAFALELMRQGIIDEIDFYFIENSKNHVMAIMHDAHTDDFTNEQRENVNVHVGPLAIDEAFVERFRDNPNPKRLVVVDSPDHVVASMPMERRFAYEQVLGRLLDIRKYNRYVGYTSQLNRQGTGKPKLEHLSEADFKAQMSDLIIGLWRDVANPAVGDIQSMNTTVLAQRHGGLRHAENHALALMNMKTLQVQEVAFDYDPGFSEDVY